MANKLSEATALPTLARRGCRQEPPVQPPIVLQQLGWFFGLLRGRCHGPLQGPPKAG